MSYTRLGLPTALIHYSATHAAGLRALLIS